MTDSELHHPSPEKEPLPPCNCAHFWCVEKGTCEAHAVTCPRHKEPT